MTDLTKLDRCLFCGIQVFMGEDNPTRVVVTKTSETRWVHRKCIRGNEKQLTFKN